MHCWIGISKRFTNIIVKCHCWVITCCFNVEQQRGQANADADEVDSDEVDADDSVADKDENDETVGRKIGRNFIKKNNGNYASDWKW